MKQNLIPLAASLTLVCTPCAVAAPYASAVTMTDDTVTFILNEAADSVKVVFNEGASTQIIGASPEPAGLKTFSKAGFSSFRIEVEKNAGPGWKSGVLQQISQDSNDMVKFGVGSRGVSVNREPGSGKLLGRIYVSVGANATSGGRAVTDGIYALNADITATRLGPSALGAATFSTASARGGHTLAKTHSNGTFEITEVTAPPPAPAVNPYPQVTSISQAGNDYLIGFSSQVGRPESHVIQRSTDMELLP